MHRAKVLIIGAGLLLAAGTAFADGDGDGSGSAAAGGEGAGSGSAAATATDTGGGGAAAGGELISAPLTVGKSALGVFGELGIASISVTVPPVPPATMPTTVSSTAEALGIGAGYGVNEKLEVGGTYAFTLHDDAGTFPNNVEGPLTLFGAYNLMNGKLSVAVGAQFQIDLSNTDSKGLALGASVRYMVAPKIAIFSGNPIAPGPVGNQLSISLASNGPITFALPVGAAMQVNPKAYAWLDTELASFSISNSANEFIFSDFIPIDIGLLYRAAPNIDIGGHFTDDLKHAGDFYQFGILARYYKM